MGVWHGVRSVPCDKVMGWYDDTLGSKVIGENLCDRFNHRLPPKVMGYF